MPQIPHTSEDLADRLAKLEEQTEHGQKSAADPTLVTLRAELETVLTNLRASAAPNAFEHEPACQKVTEMVQALGRPASDDAGPDEAGPDDADRNLEMTSDTLPRSSATAHEPLAQLGVYELLSKLGEGGMGAVYKARHAKLDKIVAIKVLPTERMKDTQAVTRFEREMRAVGKLEHPHIVRAMDAGEANGVHYLAMEYVQGVDLSQLIKSCHPLEIADACELIRQAALGLEEAHDNGMVHRDIKPSNLMLCVVGKRKPPIVKILDMGLALLSEAHSPESQGLTTTGQMMGTLDYMAPEQGGDSKGVDIRADIYALGASLYKLLCGEAIYHGENFQTPVQKMMALATQPAPPIQSRRSGIPAGLSDVLQRMLAKHPSERYATPAEVAQALAPYSTGANLVALVQRAGLEAPVTKDAPTQPSLSHPETNTSVTGATQAFAAAAVVERRTKPSTSRHKSPPWKPLAIAAGLGAVALLAIAAAVVLYIPTSKGTLRVEINDPSIEVSVKGSDIVFKKDQKEEFKLNPGETELIVKRGDLIFTTKKFELKKDGIVTIQVELLPGEVRVAMQDGKSLGESKLVAAANIKPMPTGQPSSATAANWRATPEQQEWLDMAAKLQPEELVKAISEKLKAENPGFDGKLQREAYGNIPVSNLLFEITHVERIWPLRAAQDLTSLKISGPHGGGGKLADLSPLQGLKLTTFACAWSSVTDISALRGMRLTNLDLLGSPVKSLAPLEGMPLEKLNLSFAPISDLSPLKGMPLTGLFINRTVVTDLSPLQGAPLQEIQISGTGVVDISPLAGMPLKSIDMGSVAVKDLSPLRGMKLTYLYASFNANIRDISVLRGMPLSRLDLAMTSVADIAPLQGMLLETLDIRETKVADLSPLKDIPLRNLVFDIRYYEPQLAILQKLPCTHFNNEVSADFWKKFEAKQMAAEKFAAESAKLPPEELEGAIKKRLEEVNPGKVVELFSLTATERPDLRLFNRDPNTAQFDDISPLLAVPKLSKLTLQGGVPRLDLSPLLKTEIEELVCSEDQATNNRAIFAASKSLKSINGEAVADYLRKLNAQLPSAGQPSSVSPEKPVVLLRDGKPIREFKQLAGATAELKAGDVIELRGAGPFLLDLENGFAKPLHIRGAGGQRPTINFVGANKELKSTFKLEHCDFQQWVGENSYFSGGIDVRNCRWHGPKVHLTGQPSQFTARDSIFILSSSWYCSNDGTELKLTNCLVRTMGPVFNLSDATQVLFELRQNTFYNEVQGGSPLLQGSETARATVIAEGNAFHSRGQMELLGLPNWRKTVDWQGKNSLYSGVLFRFFNDKQEFERHATLDDWVKLWNKPEEGSKLVEQFEPLFVHTTLLPLPELRKVVEPVVASARERFQLPELGCNWDLVGPGEAYVRALAAAGRKPAELRPEVSAGGPFALLRAEKDVASYRSLEEAIKAAQDRDVIEIRTDGALPGGGISGEDARHLTLRAGAGYTPILKTFQSYTKDIWSFEGLTFNGTAFASPWETAGFVKRGGLHRVANCTVLADGMNQPWRMIPDGKEQPLIINSRLIRLHCATLKETAIKIENSVFFALVSGEGQKHEGGSVELAKCTFWGPEPHFHWRDRLGGTLNSIDSGVQSKIVARDCYFAPGMSLIWHFDFADSKPPMSWIGTRNVFALPFGQFASGRADTNGLAAWTKFVQQEQGSFEDLPIHWEPRFWKLTPGTPGAGAGPLGVDLGADTTRVAVPSPSSP